MFKATMAGPQRLYVEQYRLIQTLCGGTGVTDVTDITQPIFKITLQESHFGSLFFSV